MRYLPGVARCEKGFRGRYWRPTTRALATRGTLLTKGRQRGQLT